MSSLLSGKLLAMTVLTPLMLPTDYAYVNGWHFNPGSGMDINVVPLWQEGYSGKGVDVTIIDTAFNLNSTDQANIDRQASRDYIGGVGADMATGPNGGHGSIVFGVLGAVWDGKGAAGIIPEAGFTALRAGYGEAENFATMSTALADAWKFSDVINCSWRSGLGMRDHYKNAHLVGAYQAFTDAVAQGRDGLGTVIVMAAGNGNIAGALSDDTNLHTLKSQIEAIYVAAASQTGRIADFSSRGASILIAAPGEAVVTAQGDASRPDIADGTSMATPQVSGTAAMMLQANPLLGWRDVHEILAVTARKAPLSGVSDWVGNDGYAWNGGGMTFSRSAGFGYLDAKAAVHMAETWIGQGTTENVALSSAYGVTFQVADGGTSTDTLTQARNILIDKVEINLVVEGIDFSKSEIVLVSPQGTRSVLFDDADSTVLQVNKLRLSSNAFWGERSAGDWTLVVTDRETGTQGTIKEWSIRVIGDESVNETFVFTNELSDFAAADASRRTIVNRNGGTDTINAAAVDTASVINITTGRAVIDGVSLTLKGGFHNVVGGDGDDTLTGNTGNNIIRSGRGNDRIDGGAGSDAMHGGQGDDIYYVDNKGDKVIELANEGTDTVRSAIDYALTANVEQLVLTGTVAIGRGNGLDNLVLGNDLANRLYGEAGDDRIHGGSGNDSIYGGEGNDRLYGDEGNDSINGGPGADVMVGGLGNDAYVVDDAGDRVVELANEGIDIVYASVSYTLPAHVERLILTGAATVGRGNDLANVLTANDLGNTLNGLGGNDVIQGGAGNDSLGGGDGDDILIGGLGIDNLNGGAGRDIFRFNVLAERGDQIYGFEDGLDRIDVAGLLKEAGYRGSDPFADGYVSWAQSGAKVNVVFDADGSAGAGAAVVLAGIRDYSVAKMDASDFVW